MRLFDTKHLLFHRFFMFIKNFLHMRFFDMFAVSWRDVEFCNLVFFYYFICAFFTIYSTTRILTNIRSIHVQFLIHFKYHMVIRNVGGILLRCSLYNLIKFSCTFNSKLNSLNTECGVSSSYNKFSSLFFITPVVCMFGAELGALLLLLYGFSCYARFELCAAICNVGDITYSREIM